MGHRLRDSATRADIYGSCLGKASSGLPVIAGTLQEFLTDARVDDAVFALRSDYRAALVAVDGLIPRPSAQASDALLAGAEEIARRATGERQVEQLPHVAAWRDAYRAFGAKPQ